VNVLNYVLDLQDLGCDERSAAKAARSPSTASWWACYSNASWAFC
jgi:hypothetical protein